MKSFLKRATKRQEFQKLPSRPVWQSALFITIMTVKKPFFLDIYIDENNRARQAMIEEIDWQMDMVELVSQIFWPITFLGFFQ